MKTNVYTHESCLEHDTGPGHPERIDRLRTVLKLLDEAPFKNLSIIQGPEAPLEWICRAHPAAYVEMIENKVPEEGHAYADPDTVLSPGSWEAMRHAAGSVCQAVDDVISGKCTRAFCAVRPPGHHAGAQKAEGFCLFNNIFIGAQHARAAHRLDRVAILDFDVHHGNGTDALARPAQGIFFASSHQWPLYPGTGVPEDDEEGRIINVTLKAGDGSEEFRKAWAGRILPQLEIFDPQLIMISAGFDAHRLDPLAQINLDDEDYAWVTREIVKIANKHCAGRIVSVLEGGYSLKALKSSLAAHLSALLS